MNELGRIRGQLETFLMPVEASAATRQTTEVPGDKEHLKQEVNELSKRVEEAKASLRKDLSGLEDLLRRLKESQKEGTAEAEGRGHELQLTIWKVDAAIDQVREVLTQDDVQYKKELGN
ncbi:transmembrane protein [Cystoisospora suis]|uniref:Transmembrane protein n=1 Tax=Cystoisospora suis TaxID=483139 RepID=A0A2C6KZ12_9APIC|nr:transmembrane protein [Cystoisospora suis]